MKNLAKKVIKTFDRSKNLLLQEFEDVFLLVQLGQILNSYIEIFVRVFCEFGLHKQLGWHYVLLHHCFLLHLISSLLLILFIIIEVIILKIIVIIAREVLLSGSDVIALFVILSSYSIKPILVKKVPKWVEIASVLVFYFFALF